MIEKDTFTGATYLPDGPQINVVLGELYFGGWTQCHKELYSNVLDDAQVDVIKEKCSGPKTLMACKKVGDDYLTLAAWANTTTVFAVTENNHLCRASCTSQVEAGSRWYRTPKAWGFAAADNSIYLNNVDRADIRTSGQEGTGGTRLSYFIDDSTLGYRCGETKDLNNDADNWERVFFNAN